MTWNPVLALRGVLIRRRLLSVVRGLQDDIAIVRAAERDAGRQLTPDERAALLGGRR